MRKIYFVIYITLFFMFFCTSRPLCDEKKDTKLKQAIMDRLSMDSRINNLFMEVDVQENKAVLSGRALSEEDKALAEKIVKEEKGIVGVKNILEVKPLDKDDAQALKDMKQGAKTGLRFSGKTSQSGPAYAPSPYSERPGNYGQSLNRMDNSLDSSIQGGVSDVEIGSQVKDVISRLSLAGRVDNVSVMVTNGVVRLYGTVDSPQDQEKIKSAIQNIPGVVRIDDSTNLNR